jgi:hypothetical protein
VSLNHDWQTLKSPTGTYKGILLQIQPLQSSY